MTKELWQELFLSLFPFFFIGLFLFAPFSIAFEYLDYYYFVNREHIPTTLQEYAHGILVFFLAFSTRQSLFSRFGQTGKFATIASSLLICTLIVWVGGWPSHMVALVTNEPMHVFMAELIIQCMATATFPSMVLLWYGRHVLALPQQIHSSFYAVAFLAGMFGGIVLWGLGTPWVMDWVLG